MANATPETRTLIDAAVEHLPKAEVIDNIAGAQGAFMVLRRRDDFVDLHDLEALLPQPRRLKQTVTLETPQAFTAYVSDFMTVESDTGVETRVFASLDKRMVTAALDYHHPDGTPSWCAHRAQYPAAFDDSFEAWHKIHGQRLSQRQFAEFLEDRAEDAVLPDPASLMEVAQRFETIRNVDFKSAVNLSTGERQFRFEEKDKAAGTVECPRLIKLRTPVYYGAEAVEWVARLAYAIEEGKLTFTVTIHRRAELLDRQFEDLVDSIMARLPNVPFHRGVMA